MELKHKQKLLLVNMKIKKNIIYLFLVKKKRKIKIIQK